jgi:hypothetical protein
VSSDVERVETTVPLADGQSVTIAPGKPWPSAYRGSRYSVVSNSDYDEDVLKWKQRDLEVYTDAPDRLQRWLFTMGKKDGRGSVRVTADREVLTKVRASRYSHADAAPVDSGWIPTYVGKLRGDLGFGDVESDPDPPPDETVAVWRGFPFNNGERWTVASGGTLAWPWRDYQFESAFDHSELIGTYAQYRDTPGRLYVTEDGHVWVNVPRDAIPAAQQAEVRSAIRRWKQRAEERGDRATLRLVNRRLVATSRAEDPSTGQFPIQIGHLRDFDGGAIPRPVVDDSTYFKAVCEYESVWE